MALVKSTKNDDIAVMGDDYRPHNRMTIPAMPGAVITNKRPKKAKVRELRKGATFVSSAGDVESYWVLTDNTYDYKAVNVLTGESYSFLASDLVTPAVFKISVRKLRVM